MAETKDKGIRSVMNERSDATQQLDTFTVLQDVDETNLDHKAYEPDPVTGDIEEALAANPLIAANEPIQRGFNETTANYNKPEPNNTTTQQDTISALNTTDFDTPTLELVSVQFDNTQHTTQPVTTNEIEPTTIQETPPEQQALDNDASAQSINEPQSTQNATANNVILPNNNDTLVSNLDTVQTIYHYDETNPVKSLPNSRIEHVAISYNDTIHDFSFSLTFDDPGAGQNNGVVFAINGGPNPLGHAGEMAMFYFDNSGAEPVITVYAYNGEGNMLSYTNNPDTIMTSLGENTFTNISSTLNADDHHVLSFSMDATPIINHTPVNGSEDWSGVAFGDEIGIWLFPMTAVQSTYNEEGYLTDFQFKVPEALDTTNSQTSKEYIPIGTGNDILDGGDGLDIAVFAGNFEDYTISEYQDGYRITDTAPARDGDDLAFNIEFFQFADDTYSVNDDASWLDALVIRDDAPAANPLLTESIAIDLNDTFTGIDDVQDDAVVF